MSLKKRVESAERAAQNSNGRFEIFVRHDDESEEQARTRLGLDSTSAIIFISEEDALL